MKKYLLLFLLVVCASIQVNAKDIITVTMERGKFVYLTKEQFNDYFLPNLKTHGCGSGPGGFAGVSKDVFFYIKGLGRPIELSGKDKIIGYPDIRGFITIEARKQTPNLAMFKLTDDPIIKEITLPTHTTLKEVTLSNLTNLTELDLSECEGIENLIAKKLPISELNISKSTLLKTLDCSGCELETLTLPANSAVNKINCSGNKLTEEAVGELIAALPATGGELCIYDESAESNNECTAKQVEEAKAKNWKVVDASGKEYAGSGAVVNSIKVITDNADNAPYYDLQGRRIGKPTHSGLYIHNGKKIFIK